MSVSLCVVTRGNVDLAPILEHVPHDWETLIWDNSKRGVNMAVYGRFCTMLEARNDIVAFVDDDVVFAEWKKLEYTYRDKLDKVGDVMVVNDAHGDDPKGLGDVGFVGAGSIVSRLLVLKTWRRWSRGQLIHLPAAPDGLPGIYYECDYVFGVLCPHVTVKLPYVNRSPNHGDRLCDQSWHHELKMIYVEAARRIRDGSNGTSHD